MKPLQTILDFLVFWTYPRVQVKCMHSAICVLLHAQFWACAANVHKRTWAPNVAATWKYTLTYISVLQYLLYINNCSVFNAEEGLSQTYLIVVMFTATGLLM